MKLLFLLAWLVNGTLCSESPNIIYIVTDDEDQMLGSSFPTVLENGTATPLAKTQEVLVNKGMIFENMYIHVPICNPSRSTTLTGRYFHNIRTTNTSADAMHVNMNLVHNSTFALALQSRGYRTGLFGKYSNAMPTYVPLGWDAWLANAGGTYMSPSFQILNGSFIKYINNYSTSVIGNETIAWLDQVSTDAADSSFFVYVAPKACHEPFNPPPWYLDFWNTSWPDHELRSSAWNVSYEIRADHASNIPTQPMLSDQAAIITTGIFKNRWRTLLSVDDLIYDLVTKFFDNNTYIFFTSDHGFHTGHLNMIMDKRHTYEFDIKVHLVVAGPGIKPGSSTSGLATNVDLAPTFLALAQSANFVEEKNTIVSDFLNKTNGHSLLPLLFPDEYQNFTWRSYVLIEYFFNENNTKCVGECNATTVKNDYPYSDANCVTLTVSPNEDCWGPGCTRDCYPSENDQNNFIALRLINATHNLIYTKYKTGSQTEDNITFQDPDFIEIFNVSADPWNLVNLANISTTTSSDYAQLDSDLMAAFACTSADTCP